MEGYPEIEWENGWRIICFDANQARTLTGEVDHYFKHGISVRPGDVVIDAGANIGIFALTVLARTEGDVTVYSFEPIPQTIALLRENAARYGPGRIHPIASGLSDVRAEIEFAFFRRAAAWSSAHRGKHNLSAERARNRNATFAAVHETDLFPRILRLVPRFAAEFIIDTFIRAVEEFETVLCPVAPLGDFVDKYAIQRIDLLKIDVEKAELELLRGLRDRDWNIVRQIVVEVEEFAERGEVILKLLHDKGFRGAIVEQGPVQKAGDFALVYARK